MLKAFRNSHILASFILFLESLGAVAFYQGPDHDPQLGRTVLVVGILGIMIGPFSWLANAGIMIAWLGAHSTRFSPIVTAVGLGLALLFLNVHRMPQGSTGNWIAITGLGWGYYLWVSSMVVMLCGQLAAACGTNPAIGIASWITWLIISAPLFYYYHMPLQTALEQRDATREAVLVEKCSTASEHIYKTPHLP